MGRDLRLCNVVPLVQRAGPTLRVLRRAPRVLLRAQRQARPAAVVHNQPGHRGHRRRERNETTARAS